MLQNLSADVRECQRRAEECRHKAELATDPLVKADFLDMELRWLNLAETISSVSSLPGTSANRTGPDARCDDVLAGQSKRFDPVDCSDVVSFPAAGAFAAA